ncbi:glycosyltransferase family 2 protein [Salipiger mangrovisoli]|uniref:Glycosyltransferase n=1 Tax=Salipiger mangrovisoli TaxID=2865933 RepID=A0ABR9X0J3_9RHOB|nr:glycosyltransferase [Salipiger mangrovisoli]MBE9637075.1 glycosyltransferase [Salipiger mangrovisoli]
MLSVAIFAYNEEAAIIRSLEAVVAAGLAPEDRVTVLVNGTRDRTLERVAEFGARDPRFSGVDIAFGDKANAWDVYVHSLAPAEAAAHVFIDGDVRVSEGALDRMRAAMDAHPEALAFSGLPRGGRRSAGWAERVLKNHGLPGNFYMLRNALVARMKDGFWLPVGLIGDDTFLRNMILRDLDPEAEPEFTRICPVPEAYFDYESFPVDSLAGLKALWRRHNRYALREAQMHVLMRHLRKEGLPGLPKRIDAIYDQWNLWSDMRTARVGFGPRRLLFAHAIPTARRAAGRDLGEGVWFN